MEEAETSNQALFNSGLALLERINNQKKIVEMARLNHDWNVYNDALGNIRDALNPRMNKEEREKADILEREIDEILTNFNRQKKNGKRVIIDIKKLIEYNRFLGDVEMRNGMSLPDKPDFDEPENF